MEPTTTSPEAAGLVTESAALVYRAPAPVTAVQGKSIFLSGSIERSDVPWQTHLTRLLAHLPVTIFDPRRDDWDDTWVERKSDPRFKTQTEWELEQLGRADIVAVCFLPGTDAPVTLLEFGLTVRKRNVVVCCHEEFSGRGNVEMICARFGAPLVDTLDELVAEVTKRL